MFELSQLRCFVAVARELNFRRAAEHLHMTQPPLSRQIQLLEDDLNVKLFERTSRSVRLTAAGRSFFVEAQDLLKRAEAASLTARQAEAGQHGSISFGFIPVAAFDIMPRIIKAIGARAPRVNLLLHEMLTIEQIEALTAGRTDLGVIRLPREKERLELQCIQRERFVLALHAGHPLEHKETVGIEDLDGQPFVMYSPADGWYTYEILAPLFTYAQVRPKFVQYLGQTHTILALVSAGVGCALVPRSSQVIRLPNIVFRPVDLPEEACVEVFLAWRRGDDSPVVEMARNIIAENAAIDV
ncbi:LysR family transcriptional regulator [Shinella sp. BYT-45]|uniref:LysR family transcriptional regulator n=1 Tax=Shinella sp. BYT-45 TaxID=3377377 RepID=UPI0039802E3C